MCDGCGCTAELERRMSAPGLSMRRETTHTIPLPITFEYELMTDTEAVRDQISACEGKHVQQAIFSTFMDTLTQICFTCGRVRSTIAWEGGRSWTV